MTSDLVLLLGLFLVLVSLAIRVRFLERRVRDLEQPNRRP